MSDDKLAALLAIIEKAHAREAVRTQVAAGIATLHGQPAPTSLPALAKRVAALEAIVARLP